MESSPLDLEVKTENETQNIENYLQLADADLGLTVFTSHSSKLTVLLVRFQLVIWQHHFTSSVGAANCVVLTYINMVLHVLEIV